MQAQSMGWSSLVGMGAVIAAMLVIGVGLGLVLDSLAGTSPVLLFAGLVLGIAGSVSYTIAKFRQYLHT